MVSRFSSLRQGITVLQSTDAVLWSVLARVVEGVLPAHPASTTSGAVTYSKIMPQPCEPSTVTPSEPSPIRPGALPPRRTHQKPVKLPNTEPNNALRNATAASSSTAMLAFSIATYKLGGVGKHGATPRKGTPKSDLIGVFQIATDGQPTGWARHTNPKIAQHS